MSLNHYQKPFVAMGCPCEVHVFHQQARHAHRAIQLAVAEVERLDQKYSHWQPDSYLMQLQLRAQHQCGVRVDAETAALLDYSAEQYRLSGGLFDITTANLVRLWCQRTELPTPQDIERKLQNCGWGRVHWSKSVLKLPLGFALDLGGVVKEYAADRAALVLQRAGIRAAMVNLGGDVHVLGTPQSRKLWPLGISNPASPHLAMAQIEMRSGGLATSGDYERFSLIDGERFGHMINPHTGWPVQGLVSATVLAPTALVAGSLSTLALLQPQAQGLAALRASGMRWLAQDRQGNLHGDLQNSAADQVSFSANPPPPLHARSGLPPA